MTLATLNQIFLDAPARYRHRPLMRQKVGGRWIDIGIETFSTRVGRIFAALNQLGLSRGARVAILSENRPEWAMVDCACLAAGLVDVPIYTTLTPAQIGYILRDSGAQVAFVSTPNHVDTILGLRGKLPDLAHVVAFDDAPASDVVPLARFEADAVAAGASNDWQSAASRAMPDDLATLIYTSGTTGEPKGVMLSHGNIASNVDAALRSFDLSPSDDCLSFLPLCHIFERMAGYYCMLAGGAVINYATSIDHVAGELLEVKPTVLMSVPRIYEKIYARLLDTVRTRGAMAQRIFAWARAVGARRLAAQLTHRPVPLSTRAAYALADRLVFRSIRERTGGRLRLCVSGGAPLDPAICSFFLAAGITLLEGYGLTETSPVISVNTFAQLKPGTVGPPLAGVTVRIASDGEILVRGPGVMQGYFHRPDATAEAIDREGWFHTGDVGELDAEGFLRITDRKKDLIKTSGGKYVAPQPIEAMLRNNPYFSSVVMLGDGRKFPIMLLVPNFDTLERWTASRQIPFTTPEAIIAVPQVHDKLEREARKDLRDLAQFEMPKKFLVLPHDFTIAAGELTPTLKVRRRAVADHYRHQIDALYAEV